MKRELQGLFAAHYHYRDEGHLYFAPGRINLIGEHTDYTGGFVLPCGINAGTYLFVVPSNRPQIRAYSTNFNDGITTIKYEESHTPQKHWSDYIRGAIFELQKQTKLTQGFDCIIKGTIPDSSGLSSSASFELALLYALLDLNSENFCLNENNLLTMAKLGQAIENNFIGTQSGIMDQLACAFAKKNHALFINCHTLEIKPIPFVLKNHSLLVLNTHKKRKLEESKYNERRRESEEAFKIMQEAGLTHDALGEVTPLELETYKHAIKKPVLLQRISHIVEENHRVQIAVEYLKNNDIINFGKELNKSGDSLKNLFEVTGFYLDSMVTIARQTPGVIASRMTGAGFGGCAIALVENQSVESATSIILKDYYEQTGLEASIYHYHAEEGLKKL